MSGPTSAEHLLVITPIPGGLEKEKQMFGSYLDAEITYREERIRSDWAPSRRRRARGHHREPTSQQ